MSRNPNGRPRESSGTGVECKVAMRTNTLVLPIVVLAAGLLLAACDESEQDRVTRYEKGVYLGAPVTELSADQVEALRRQATRQGAN